jgi:hypothetical protein
MQRQIREEWPQRREEDVRRKRENRAEERSEIGMGKARRGEAGT